MFKLKYIIISFIFSFGVSQTDTTITIYDESDLIIVDSNSPDLNWLSPNGLENYNSLDNIILEWIALDESFTDESISIYFSQNLAYPFEAISENIPNTGPISFNLPNINSAFVRFKIVATDYYGNVNEDYSDFYTVIGEPYAWDSDSSGGQQEITINIQNESELFEGDSKLPEILWQYPNGNEEFNQDENINLQWYGYDDTFNNQSISIYFSENLGSPFNLIYENISMDDLVSVNLPSIDSRFGRFKIIAIDSYENQSQDNSDLYFTIGNPDLQEGDGSGSSITLNIEDQSEEFICDSKTPFLELISPNGGEEFNNDQEIAISWTAYDESFSNNPITISMQEQLGGYYNVIAGAISNSENFDYQLPEINSIFTRFKIAAIDSFGNHYDDLSDGYSTVGNPFNDYSVEPYEDIVIVDWEWGEHHTIFIEPNALSTLEEGAEIHFIDQNGLNNEKCSFDITTGLVSTGSYIYQGDEVELIDVNTVASRSNCNESDSYSWDYLIQGDIPEFIIFDQSENIYYETEVTGNQPFSNFGFFDIPLIASTNEEIDFSLDLNFTQSTQQAFYFVLDASLNGESLTSEDMIIAVKDDTVLGYRQWNGPYTDIPVMGNEGSYQNIGYYNDNPIYIATIDEYGFIDYFETTFSQGSGFFGEPLTVINSITPIETLNRSEDEIFENRLPEVISYSNFDETRNQNFYNIYRNQELIEENYSANIYYDNDININDNYCYEVVILDLQGEEYIESSDICLELDIGSIFGDVTQDGDVNVLDVVSIVGYILGSQEYGDAELQLADYTQDGSVNVLDVVAIVQIILE